MSAFDTPEQVAMGGFPPRYCRVVASAIDGDDAFVLLDTGSDGRQYLYGVWCHKRDGRWAEGGSSNGAGWSQRGDDPSVGMLAFWDEAPADADAVRINLDGALQESPVTHGAFLAMWWNIPCPPLQEWPRAVAFRIDGRWIEHANPWVDFLSGGE